MKLLKIVVVALVFTVSGAAMAANVGEYRQIGQTPHDGEVACQRTADSARKGRAPANEEMQHKNVDADLNSKLAQ